ncbi:hypothetical protein [Oerskovia turbata]
MSILTEFFVATPAQALALAGTGPEGSGLPTLLATSIDPVRLSALHEVLTGAADGGEDDVLGPELGPTDPDGPWLLPFRPDAVTALAAIPDQGLPEAARAWGASEDMEDLGVDPVDLLDITASLRDLARAAGRDGHGLYLWISL